MLKTDATSLYNHIAPPPKKHTKKKKKVFNQNTQCKNAIGKVDMWKISTIF